MKGDEKDLENIARTMKCKKDAKIRCFGNYSELEKYLQGSELKSFEFVVIILDQHDKDLYRKFKRICNEKGAVLQCIVRPTFSKNSVIFNIVVQLQAKMGIAVWRLTKFALPSVLVIGVSIVKLKKSNDFNAAMFSYRTDDLESFYSQKFNNRDNVKSIYETGIKKCIDEYKAKSKKLPDTVLLYVEGAVGAVEENTDAKQEIEQVESVLAEYAKEKKIGLTYIDVMKRVSARFAFKEGAGFVNAPLGTVVDNTITGEKETAFYLVAAPANQGCANPCKYIVRTSAPSLPLQQVQDITFKLCHLYFNWQGIIRVPAPVMYAGKLNEYSTNILETDSAPISVDTCKKIFFI